MSVSRVRVPIVCYALPKDRTVEGLDSGHCAIERGSLTLIAI